LSRIPALSAESLHIGNGFEAVRCNFVVNATQLSVVTASVQACGKCCPDQRFLAYAHSCECERRLQVRHLLSLISKEAEENVEKQPSCTVILGELECPCDTSSSCVSSSSSSPIRGHSGGGGDLDGQARDSRCHFQRIDKEDKKTLDGGIWMSKSKAWKPMPTGDRVVRANRMLMNRYQGRF